MSVSAQLLKEGLPDSPRLGPEFPGQKQHSEQDCLDSNPSFASSCQGDSGQARDLSASFTPLCSWSDDSAYLKGLF